jgi:hypothetical protein
MLLLAIDPGNMQSAYVLVKFEDYSIEQFGKVENEVLQRMLENKELDFADAIIESVACYGMAVGKEVFETCEYTGIFHEAIRLCHMVGTKRLTRNPVKVNLCGTTKAKDSNIIQALKDRFGDKGTKANPGFFYGFKADCWQAYALAVTYIDLWRLEHD